MATTLERLRVIIDGEIGPFKRKMQEATGTVKRSQNKINQATSGMQQVVRNRRSLKRAICYLSNVKKKINTTKF